MVPAARIAGGPSSAGDWPDRSGPAAVGQRDGSVGPHHRRPQWRRLAGCDLRHAAIREHHRPLGKCQGTFGSPIRYDDRTGINDVAAADVEGDGDLDLITCGGEGQQAGFSVLRNLGMSGFGLGRLGKTRSCRDGLLACCVVARDLDGDGNVDVALASTADVSVFLGQAGGTFGDPVSYALGPGRRSLASGDMDADGDLGSGGGRCQLRTGQRAVGQRRRHVRAA